VQWKDYFFHHVQSRDNKLTNAILKPIEMQRNGETMDQILVKKVVESFVSLGLDDTNNPSLEVYKADFEAPFISATEKYYTAESEAFLQSNTVSDYLRKAEERLREEEERVKPYLNENTHKILISKCEHVLIRVHSERMLEEFENLLDYDKDEDLQRMYALLARIPEGLEPLRKKLRELLKGDVRAETLARIYFDALLEVYRKNQHTAQG